VSTASHAARHALSPAGDAEPSRLFKSISAASLAVGSDSTQRCHGTRTLVAASPSPASAMQKHYKEELKSRSIHAGRLNVKNARGDTALTFAIHEKRARLVSLLLGADVDLAQVDRAGRTPVELAFQLGQIAVAKQLMGAKARADGFDHMPLTFSCAVWGRLDFIERLLAGGADPNAANADGETLLIAAAANNHLKLILLLMQNGADCRATKHDGMNAAMAAAANGHLPALQYFVGDLKLPLRDTTSRGLTAMLIAAMHGHRPIIRYLAAQGADVYARSSNGENAAMLAAAGGHTATLGYLIEKFGVPLNAISSDDGQSALHMAASHGHVSAVRYLIERGADAAMKTIAGEDAAGLAAMNGHAAAQCYLRSPAVSDAVSARTVTADTPLSHLSCGFDEIVADIKAQRTIDATRFKFYLARAKSELWISAAGLERFLKTLYVLLSYLDAFPAIGPAVGHTSGQTSNPKGKLGAFSFVKLVIAELVDFYKAIPTRRFEAGFGWTASGDFRGHLEGNLKCRTTPQMFLRIFEVAYGADRLQVKETLREQLNLEEFRKHRRVGYLDLIAEYERS
jgi:ankyrin repeat protein